MSLGKGLPRIQETLKAVGGDRYEKDFERGGWLSEKFAFSYLIRSYWLPVVLN